MNFENLKDLAAILGFILALCGFGWALYVFRNNSRLERAKWLEKLYDKYYEDDRLKAVRDTIDSDDAAALKRISEYVEKEPSEFTDYLNFLSLWRSWRKMVNCRSRR